MRALVFSVAVVAVVGQIPVRAQVPDAQSATSDPDFSGIYEGAPTIIEPDVYPLTAEGERAHGVYDPLIGDPRQTDDCAPESMPAILWAGTLNTMRIYLEGDTIAMHLEHGGTVRSIHMVGARTIGGRAAYRTGLFPGELVGRCADRRDDASGGRSCVYESRLSRQPGGPSSPSVTGVRPGRICRWSC